MRALLIALLGAAAAACGTDPAADERPIAQAAAVAFDGAEARHASEQIAHGERLTSVLGCRGCHGKDLQGQLWDDNPKEYGVMWASNITRTVPANSDEQLRRLLVKGVHPRRKELWVMPSELFQHLAESDLEALVAYLRTLPPAGETSPDPKLGPRALREIASGEVKPAAQLVRELKDVGPVDLGEAHALGRYITRVTCAECHGAELKGRPGDTPDLITTGVYSREEFEKLITKGEAPGGRKIGDLMQSVAKNRFSRLTPHERDALYAYLKGRAERPQ
jgi:mono/diheme cytochrome c family protein